MKINMLHKKHKDFLEIFIERKKDLISFYIDKKDYRLIKDYKWRLLDGKKTYVRGRYKGKEPTILLHRLLLNVKPGQHVDHINGNGLDNRRNNLRIATRFQNNQNAKIRKDNSSGYRGVHKTSKGYCARIQYNNKRISLGYFATAKQAAVAYNKAAKEYHGEYAKINII